MIIPVFLLLDDFSGHWIQPVRNYATAINVIMLKVPPGYTSVCRPVDVCWMKPFMDQIFAQWIGFRENVGDWIRSAWDHLSIKTISGGYGATHTAVVDEKEPAFFVVSELATLSLLDTMLEEIDSDNGFDK
uniref:AlNc14C414G11477 protein n=1 Tax=Albugo laibachii Nc14 TaxID=890382 RepID=F0WZ71_9STRA|nr:AlNc14C414G11477 [Albugo laibachii Nc14]|eukprot:CCA26787.1 AlNc14C414G11477 [Albugo laibachii Nc14]